MVPSSIQPLSREQHGASKTGHCSLAGGDRKRDRTRLHLTNYAATPYAP